MQEVLLRLPPILALDLNSGCVRPRRGACGHVFPRRGVQVVLLTDACHFAKLVFPLVFGRVILTLRRSWQKYRVTQLSIINKYNLWANFLQAQAWSDRFKNSPSMDLGVQSSHPLHSTQEELQYQPSAHDVQQHDALLCFLALSETLCKETITDSSLPYRTIHIPSSNSIDPQVPFYIPF
jgi:hypothetical protein